MSEKKKESIIEKYGLEIPKVECPLCKEMIGASGLSRHLAACEEAQKEKETIKDEKTVLEIYDFLQVRKKQEELEDKIDQITELIKELPINFLNVLGNRICDKINKEISEWFREYKKDLDKIKNQNGFLVNLCKEMKNILDTLKKIRIIGAEPR